MLRIASERHIIPSGLSVQDGVEAMDKLLDGAFRPDGVFAFNDNVEETFILT